MDTAYDAERYSPQQIGFASEAYFELLNAAPELGPALALGERVLVVYGDMAYEIVPGEGDGEVTLPTNNEDDTPTADPAEPGGEPTENGEPAEQPATAEVQAFGAGLCASAVILPMFLGVLAGGFSTRTRRRRNRSAL